MPKIVHQQAYRGEAERIGRLGLTPLLEKIRILAAGFELRVHEEEMRTAGPRPERRFAPGSKSNFFSAQ